MATNIKVTRQGGESSANVLRKFSYQVRGSGILLDARAKTTRQRPLSRNMRRLAALKRLTRRSEILKMIKEGKLKEKKTRVVPTSTSGR